ncbi:unnamed protein product [Vicia faba]|uniref:Uncharacterized protein n=1 Tax=Vicia faba TaxID=3906 RepID=A0AAV1AMS0_VICFA|nr:unnamed protein product [Vicia faba]
MEQTELRSAVKNLSATDVDNSSSPEIQSELLSATKPENIGDNSNCDEGKVADKPEETLKADLGVNLEDSSMTRKIKKKQWIPKGKIATPNVIQDDTIEKNTEMITTPNVSQHNSEEENEEEFWSKPNKASRDRGKAIIQTSNSSGVHGNNGFEVLGGWNEPLVAFDMGT